MSRNLITVGEHTIDASLLKPGGWVLDAGCRDFTFARGLAERGCRVLAMDADPTVEDPRIEGVRFLHCALAATDGVREIVMTADPQARHLDGLYTGSGSAPRRKVVAVTPHTLTTPSIGEWDAVKLDIEGAEYDILKSWPGPIARQISIEFHEHCAPRPPELYGAIFSHLAQWYDVVQHPFERRHCLPPNYWDTLLALRVA
jgi:FkbM family methyltransferase